MKPRLLILADWFPPAHKAGGPIRSVANMARALSGHFEIAVICGSRDWGDTQPLSQVPLNRWTSWENIQVCYADEQLLKSAGYKKMILEWKPDVIHMNSLYSLHFTLKPVWWFRKSKIRLVLAPRNMLHREALNIKRKKKTLFLTAFKLLGLPEKITWHASNAAEAGDIRQHFGETVRIMEAGNFPDQEQPAWKTISKQPGELRLVGMMRVNPMKNIDFLLRVLSQVKSKWILDVYGNAEDQAYFNLCQEIIQQHGMSSKINWKGALPYEQVKATILDYHFLVMPSAGENYGHAIADAFIAGRPVLISDKTPWKALEQQGLGWELELKENTWIQTLEKAAAMEEAEWQQLTAQARSFGEGLLRNEKLAGDYLRLLAN